MWQDVKLAKLRFEVTSPNVTWRHDLIWPGSTFWHQMHNIWVNSMQNLVPIRAAVFKLSRENRREAHMCCSAVRGLIERIAAWTVNSCITYIAEIGYGFQDNHIKKLACSWRWCSEQRNHSFCNETYKRWRRRRRAGHNRSRQSPDWMLHRWHHLAHPDWSGSLLAPCAA